MKGGKEKRKGNDTGRGMEGGRRESQGSVGEIQSNERI